MKTLLIIYMLANGQMTVNKMSVASPETCESLKVQFAKVPDIKHVDCVNKQVKSKQKE